MSFIQLQALLLFYMPIKCFFFDDFIINLINLTFISYCTMNDANYQKSIHFKDQLLKLLENLDKMSSIFFIQNESSIELLNQSNQLHRGI